MSKNMLDSITIDQDAPNCVIIGLHGLGANGHDLTELAQLINSVPEIQAQWVLPHAPIRPVGLNNNLPCNAWHDVQPRNNSRDILQWDVNFDDIWSSVSQVHDHIDALDDQFKSLPIFMLGFSQGGTIALTAGLTYDKPIAGIIGLSTYLAAAQDGLEEQLALSAKETPLLLCHGDQDQTVPIELGLQAVQSLSEMGLDQQLTWEEFSAGHQLSQGMVENIQQWVSRILSNN